MMIVSRQAASPNEGGFLPRQAFPLADFRAFRLLLARRKPIRTTPISCPACHASSIRRSKRRSAQDHLFAFAGVLPWRCETCQTRFRARLLPLRTLFHAHCSFCGNVELQRISPERMPGVTGTLGRILRLPAWRCEPCRHRFFSVRPLREEEHPVAAAPSK